MHQDKDKPLREVSIELNKSGFKTSTGMNFKLEQVRRLLRKVSYLD
jgi:hypothetical protein